MYVAKVILLIILYMLIYLSVGTTILRIVNDRDFSFSKAVIIGFFGYYGCFQFVALPLIFMKKPLHLLANIWKVFLPAAMIIMLCISFKIWMAYLVAWRKKHNWKSFAIWILIVFIIVELIYSGCNEKHTWDATFYIGTINTALTTDTMYQIEPYAGIKYTVLNMRYALSGFGMHDAVMCKLFNIHPLIEIKLVMGSIDILLANVVVYLIAQTIFTKNVELWYIMPMINLIYTFNFMGTSMTNATFLFFRSYEAKAFCGNVIVPVVIWLCLCLWRNICENKYWKLLCLIMFSCCAISMSSMLIAPILVFSMLFPAIIIERKAKKIIWLLVGMVPCASVAVLMLLYQKQILLIPI